MGVLIFDLFIMVSEVPLGRPSHGGAFGVVRLPEGFAFLCGQQLGTRF